jgi:Ser/Thr protein kinase RdoA (MazF antagonist)
MNPGMVTGENIVILLKSYGVTVEAIQHINTSENVTFRVLHREGRAILRLYRIGHRTRSEIEAELDWMQTLNAEQVARTPSVILQSGGERVGEIPTSSGITYAVLFEELPGDAPSESMLEHWFGRLGEICAQLHRHGSSSGSAVRNRRPIFDWNNLIGTRPVWGSFSKAPGLQRSAMTTLERTSERIRLRLQAYGQSSNQYGLIHGDLRLQNLLVHESSVQVIDFDDCGSCWLLYDLATALSLLEDMPTAQTLLESWVEGYSRQRKLATADLRIIPDLIMMRRLQVLGWLGSRHDSELAREYAPIYVPATVAAADNYLSGRPSLSAPAR